MATAGEDLNDCGTRGSTAAGIDTSLVKQVAGKFTASFFCSTDRHNNQIASFYTGAMADAGELSFRGVEDLRARRSSRRNRSGRARWCSTRRSAGHLGDPVYIFDPGQQVARMSGDELKDGTIGASILICNDYEYEILKQKTGLERARRSSRP